MKVELVDTFMDDHLMCIRLLVDGEPLTIWWCGWEGAAAAQYANSSPQAMEYITNLIEEQRKQDKEEDEDDRRHEGEVG